MTYGEVRHGDGWWGIKCEPHVRARLKRVFPRAPQQPGEVIMLSDNPENSRELLWFLQRYPMDLHPPGMLLQLLEAKAAQHVDMEQRLADLLAMRTQITAFELAKPPRDYQSYGATMLGVRGGLLLADDVGLGKTITAICPMALPANLPAVVVCPAHLPDHWCEKLAEFAPQLRVHRLSKGEPYDLIKRMNQRRRDMWTEIPDVIVTSYHKLRGWADTLGELAKYVVFDECQQLRHDSSQIYQASKYLAGKCNLRMGLSATPIYNYGAEFFSVIEALVPGALGTREEFVREWCTGGFGEKARLQDSEQFGGYLRREGIMLRRTRRDVNRELPKVSKIPHTVASDSSTLDRLTGDAVALARIILSHNEAFQGQRMQAAGQFDGIMRQATGIAKAVYVAEFVRILIENGQSVVLFGWHHEVYRIWKEKLADFNPVQYTGIESAPQKRMAKEAFLSGASRVLMMSLRSGAGVDGLQDVCSTVVFGELDWSPGVHEQCIGRVDRDGQKEPVQAYFLVSEEGSDPIIQDVLGIKREQIEGVRNPGMGQIERIDLGENTLRRLAADFLVSKGLALPAKPEVITLHPTETA